MTKPMPTFTWEAPNIHPLPSAEWAPSKTLSYEGEDDFWGGIGRPHKPKGGYKPPSNCGTAFYKCLRKLGYQREGTGGDYR